MELNRSNITYLIEEIRKETTRKGNKLLDELIELILIELNLISKTLKPKEE